MSKAIIPSVLEKQPPTVDVKNNTLLNTTWYSNWFNECILETIVKSLHFLTENLYDGEDTESVYCYSLC
jgi:hypothetical protein